MSTPTAGWFPDPDPRAQPGQRRYFDGTAWTDHVQAELPVPPAGARPAAQYASPPEGASPFYAMSSAFVPPRQRHIGRNVAIVLSSVVGLFILIAILSPTSGDGTNAAHTTPNGAAVPGPAPALAGQAPTCEALYPDVIALSAKESAKTGTPEIVAIYTPAVVVDNRPAYLEGNLPIPPGELQVVVLTCTGTASASDSANYPISFSMLVDANDEKFVEVKDAT